MKKITANASNWIDGNQAITITGTGYKRTVKSKVCDEIKVSCQSIGPRGRYNPPAWHVWRGSDLDKGITIDVVGTTAIAMGYGISREQQIGGDLDITDAVAVAAWKLYCNF